MMTSGDFMGYTPEQIGIIEKLESGLNYWRLSDNEQELVRYFTDCGIACPRVDIEDGRYNLTQTGKQALFDIRKERRAAEIETRRQFEELQERESIRQENIRKEKQAKDERYRELKQQQAAREKEKRSDRKFQIFLALMQALLAFVAGVLAEHFGGIINLVASFIS